MVILHFSTDCTLPFRLIPDIRHMIHRNKCFRIFIIHIIHQFLILVLVHDSNDFIAFLRTGIGRRMRAAALAGKLQREQQFMMGFDADKLYPEVTYGDMVLVQGIIDAYFMEGDEIVLVDYKTDRVKRGQEQKLIDLYHVQLEDYARALERMTGKRVKEKIIYSFTLQKEILL